MGGGINMWERLQLRVKDLKAKDTASVKAYFITEAIKGFGHGPLLGGKESADYLHNMGMDDQTIIKMQRKYYKDPHGTRESLERTIYESLKA